MERLGEHGKEERRNEESRGEETMAEGRTGLGFVISVTKKTYL